MDEHLIKNEQRDVTNASKTTTDTYRAIREPPHVRTHDSSQFHQENLGLWRLSYNYVTEKETVKNTNWIHTFLRDRSAEGVFSTHYNNYWTKE